MAVTNNTFAVTTTAQALPLTGAFDSREGSEVTIDNSSASEVVVGGASVTTANGIRVAAGAKERFIVRGDSPLYIIAAGAATIRYMVSPLYSS